MNKGFDAPNAWRGPLRAYINGQELGRSESHTYFDGIYALAYHRKPVAHTPLEEAIGLKPMRRHESNIELIRDKPAILDVNWPELAISTLNIPARLIQQHADPELTARSLLRVFPTTRVGLNVSLNGVQVQGEPLAVSFSREKQTSDRAEQALVVLVYPKGTVITEDFGGEAFRKMVPAYRDSFEGEGGKSYLGSKAVRMNKRRGIKVLMITVDVDLKEVAQDREQIKQLFVVARPKVADRLNLALTEGLVT